MAYPSYLGRLRPDDLLSFRVWDQHGQHSKTPSLYRRKKNSVLLRRRKFSSTFSINPLVDHSVSSLKSLEDQVRLLIISADGFHLKTDRFVNPKVQIVADHWLETGWLWTITCLRKHIPCIFKGKTSKWTGGKWCPSLLSPKVEQKQIKGASG